MRFLRMLTNSLIAGGLGAAYLTVLVLQLNPQVPLLSDTTWRWFATFGTLYGVHLAVTFYVLIVVREFVALDGLSPGWASVRLLAWMSAVLAALAAVLMWLNVEGFRAALTDVAARRMTTGAMATTASAVVLLAIAVAHYSFGRRGSKVGAGLFVIAAFGSLALPLAARGRAVPPPSLQHSWSETALSGVEPGPRVVMLLLDGGSLDYVWPRTAEGRLPNFARLLEKGAWMDVATVRPTQPDTVWAAVATGMYASKNGVRSAASYYARNDSRAVDLLPDHMFSHVLVHLGFLHDEPNASSAWRARPLWAILADAGLSVGVVRWPMTYPAPSVPGFVVSDRFHLLVGSIAGFNWAAYPPELLPLLQTPGAGGPPEPAPEGGGETPEGSAMARDRLYSGALAEASKIVTPRFVALRYDGLDTVGHYYFQYTQSRTSRGVPEEERRRLSQVIDRYYAYIDGEIGAAIDSLAPGDLLIVVSGFGMERLNPVKQAIGRLFGDPDFSGTHERAPDGFLLAYGTDTQSGRRQRGSIVDIAPTILYFLGLPIARDMDGYARADLFSRTFTAERPIAFIPSYNR